MGQNSNWDSSNSESSDRNIFYYKQFDSSTTNEMFSQYFFNINISRTITRSVQGSFVSGQNKFVTKIFLFFYFYLEVQLHTRKMKHLSQNEHVKENI